MSDSKKGLTYAATGVNYDTMDPFKRVAQLAARDTDRCADRFGFKVVGWSRGESAFLIETPWGYIAHVEEGLGTKNLVADAMLQLVDGISFAGRTRTFYDQVAQCNVAMAVNDMITLGALPVSYAQHLAVGDSDWFKNDRRCHDLVEGTKRACLQAGCVWGGGETPTLQGIVLPLTAVLSGSATGIIAPKEKVINPGRIKDGDVIVMFTSSGVHANGYTLARKIAKKLPDGYLTQVNMRQTYGEMLLDPTHIYVELIRSCQMTGIDIHYAVNVTGHGWRKLMRAEGNFTYVIDELPPNPSPIFRFIQQHGPVSDKEAYSTFNMGAGFAIYVAPEDVSKVLEAAQGQPFQAYVAGHIEASSEKKVVISPLGIEFGGNTLAVR
ncbi:MAG: phosphoribosylformylglycinamidine cyclo-ligase [Candidatus Magasanikbacteria bacterium]|nr:phosphoribosylformylglycinamidine cyclo-ligase [Candidatus Magasanikbacteria bacterium]